jgi:hypothetical protein
VNSRKHIDLLMADNHKQREHEAAGVVSEVASLQPGRMTLPMEIIMTIILHCTGPTIIRFRQVNKRFKNFVDNHAVAKRATFGLFPKNVMLRIFEYMTRPYVEGNTLIVVNDDDIYAWLARFERVNTTYNALMHHHVWLTPYLNRGGRVYTTLEEWGHQWQHIAVHPAFFAIDTTLVSTLDTLRVRPYGSRRGSPIALLELQVRNEFATTPPFTRLFLDGDTVPIVNESGVRVIDVMRRYCSYGIRPSNLEMAYYSHYNCELAGRMENAPLLYFTDV